MKTLLPNRFIIKHFPFLWNTEIPKAHLIKSLIKTCQNPQYTLVQYEPNQVGIFAQKHFFFEDDFMHDKNNDNTPDKTTINKQMLAYLGSINLAAHGNIFTLTTRGTRHAK